MEEARYSERVAKLSRADSVTAFTAGRLKLGEMEVTKLRLDHPTGEITEPLGGRDDALVVSVSLHPGYARDAWVNGRALPAMEPMDVGASVFIDLRDANQTLFRTSIRMIQFYFSRQALNLCADEQGSARLGDLQHSAMTPLMDPTFHQLAKIIGPALARPEEVNRLFVDSVLAAGTAHLLDTYGGVRGDKPYRGGLAPRQLRGAMDMLEADIDGDLSLAAIATECRLSPRHFARAFSQSTGVPPHRWLLQRRVEKAKDLLRNPSLSLLDVARATRFSNQSHFNRSFSAIVGHTPGAWRRARS